MLQKPFLITACLAVCSLPAAVWAACFDRSDMARGVEVVFTNGNSVIMRRNNTGMVEAIEIYFGDDTATLYTGPHGLYFIEEVDYRDGARVDGTELLIDFSPAGGTPPKPSLGLSWRGSTVNIFSDGYRREEIYSVSIAESRSYDLSGCTYEAYIASVRYEWPGEKGGFGLEYAYLPALDAAFLLSSAVDDQSIPPNVPERMVRATK